MNRTLISTSSVSCLALALIVAFFSGSANAQSNSVSADKPVASKSDNSGKKLAVASFSKQVEDSKEAAGQSYENIKKTVEKSVEDFGNDYLPKLKGKKVTINVPEVEIPPNLQDLCEDCLASSQQVAQYVREHAMEFGSILSKYVKQFSESTRLTPVSSPYNSDGRVVPHDFGLKSTNKFFTPEGRLKTVVQR